MEIKYGESLEFDEDSGQQNGVSSPLPLDKEEALRQIIRHGFRAPGGGSPQISLIIDGNSYSVFNLSANGVGIYLNEPGQLEEQTRHQGMTLVIGEQSFIVDGTIVHLSNDGAHDLCGVDLTSMTPECQDAILNYLQKSKNSLFSS